MLFRSQEGIKELEKLLEIASYGDYLDQIKTNFTIVRGLAYYDGFCVETNLNFKVIVLSLNSFSPHITAIGHCLLLA